jgi:2-C-methyl-D-erythritol 4-phosphate cytidylyltransferase
MRADRATQDSAPPESLVATAIVPAAGIGSRFGPEGGKQYIPLGGRPLLAWVLWALDTHPLVGDIIPVVREEDLPAIDEVIVSGGYGKVQKPVMGGGERQDSVYNALKALESPEPLILIHDGVRPFLSSSLITRTIKAVEGHDGAVAAVPPKDTIKQGVKDQSSGNTLVERTIERSTLWSVQTPQVFRSDMLRSAYDDAMNNGVYCTDDSALVERMGGRVAIVEGYYENIKVTTAEDMAIADAIIRGGLPE